MYAYNNLIHIYFLRYMNEYLHFVIDIQYLKNIPDISSDNCYIIFQSDRSL